MFSEAGFIKLFRKLLSWQWRHDTRMVSIWIYCLLYASYTGYKDKGYDIPIGSFSIKINEFAKEVGVTPRVLRSCLDKMEKSGEIVTKNVHYFTIIKVLNYADYQFTEKDFGKLFGKSDVSLTSVNGKSDVTFHPYIEELKKERSKELKKESKRYCQDDPTNLDADRVIDYLNQKLGSKYQHQTNRKWIVPRLNQGFTVEDCIKVIDIKYTEWISDEKMRKFIRPSTLFGGKFEQYLNQDIKISRPDDYDINVLLEDPYEQKGEPNG